MASPTGYSLSNYGEMIRCKPRMAAYADALRQAVTPGCTVIDIGAGSGIFSLLACQFGAGSVIAIEPDDAVEMLRLAAVANGYEDRITVIQGLSTDYIGSVKADVIISDLRGCLPLFEGHIPAIADARTRLLAPGGRLIPARDYLRIALAHDPKTYRSCEGPWLSRPYGLDLSASHRFTTNQWSKVNLASSNLLSRTHDLHTLDYSTVTDPNISAEVMLVAESPGIAHGFVIWFDTELAPGIGFSNNPSAPKLIYGQAFFPFERPVSLDIGDSINVGVRANLVKGAYVWSWNSEVLRKGSSKPEATYRQSSFLAKVLSPQKLARRSNRYVPPSQLAHAIDSFCLPLFDGQNSLGEIAEKLAAEFPRAFGNSTEALNHVAELAERYHRDAPDRNLPEPATLPAQDALV